MNFDMKKIVIAGGTGFLGSSLTRYYKNSNIEICILTRNQHVDQGNIKYYQWDGKNIGFWQQPLENADAVINLNGKSVDCRYTWQNKQLIYSTRLDATYVLGMAILSCKNPPGVWLNASSATIYEGSFTTSMDEHSGVIGSDFSMDVCKKWEAVFNSFSLPATRKVALRTGLVFGRNGGPLRPLTFLSRLGLGGHQGTGRQFVSWVHEEDFARAVDFLIHNESLEGIFNITSPQPCTNAQFMKGLRKALGIPFGIPLPKLLLKMGARLIGTETELVLKSRKVVPKRLLKAGFEFRYNKITDALNNLIRQENTIA